MKHKQEWPKQKMQKYRNQLRRHLENELLPFWIDRCRDDDCGGFITHFEEKGKDTGEDEKSLVAQARTIYTMSSAHRSGYGDGICEDFARHGVDFLIEKMWDAEQGGFYWTVDRRGQVRISKKILYGLSFSIYALSEYTLATNDKRGIHYAEKTFNLIQKHAVDTMYGGYFEMFERNWELCEGGAGGGDRKTLDVHMHLMEALTTLYECTRKQVHLRKLKEVIEILTHRMLHHQYRTGVPQFWRDWSIAPQIKFDIIWGWDRFSQKGTKVHSHDNTSFGHNVELAWLLLHALDIMGKDRTPYLDIIKKLLDHAAAYGIDSKWGGVFVEGSHSGDVYDREKEFWQQAEVMIGMLDGCIHFQQKGYWDAYENVHYFVFKHMINRQAGEWYPLLNQKGKPIWTHMSHSWKVNYHTVRCMIQCIQRLNKLMELFPQKIV
ncbi:MAG: N-acylglucosamine 2-epimerase [Candidatus Aminicenantes bacterium]|nr:N-acylglucosamine 2-epimerase [Candidatus Aminicenantes bacterium]